MATLLDKHRTAMPNNTHVLLYIADADYTATTVTLTFGSGTTDGLTQTVNVTIIDDGVVEVEEMINIRIFGLSVSAEHAVISSTTGNGTITIISNDSKFDK